MAHTKSHKRTGGWLTQQHSEGAMHQETENTKRLITVALTHDEAYHLAQFLKRAGYSDWRTLAANDEEGWIMQGAGYQLSKSLSDAGFNPR